MRVTIITFGSLGDVQPYVALGVGLQMSGHTVRIATHSIYETLIRARGLDFSAVDGDPRDMLGTEMGHRWLSRGHNGIGFMRGLMRVAKPLMRQILTQCWNACQATEAIAVSLLGSYAGYHIAEKLKVPLFLAYYLPVSPTRAFPSALVGTEISLGTSFNLLTHHLAGQVFWQPLQPSLNKLRRELLDLSPLPFRGIAGEVNAGRWPILYGYSPAVIPKPPEWGHHIHVTGYWFLDTPTAWRPPPDLTAFLEAGQPPVYIGFGSMSSRDPEATTGLVLKALARAGQRGVLLTGWGGLSQSDLPDDVFKIESIPHEWLFPRMTAVVHHGGAGTTGAGLRAGVPSAIIPFFADQPFWGAQVYKSGAGPRPIPRRQLTVDNLAKAIREATSDKSMQHRAAMLGKRIRAEAGVERAVEAFNEHSAGSAGRRHK